MNKVRLDEFPAGELFKYEGSIALKSEYRTNKGACECYLLGSGEMFWGGTNTAEDLNALLVELYEDAHYTIQSIDLTLDFADFSNEQKLKEVQRLCTKYLTSTPKP